MKKFASRVIVLTDYMYTAEGFLYCHHSVQFYESVKSDVDGIVNDKKALGERVVVDYM